MKLERNKSLSSHTSFKTGGLAKLFAEVNTEDEFICTLKTNTKPLLILGAGTNVVISEKGFDGLVLIPKYKYLNKFDGNLWEVSAGYPFDDFVLETIKDNLYGVECLSGIPGNVGSAPVQNIGAYGQEVSQTVYKIKCFDLLTSSIKIIKNNECEFSYRSSAFKNGRLNKLIILSVTFKLNSAHQSTAYKNELLKGISNNNLFEVRNEVLKIRGEKGMLLTKDNNSVGSFFTNPIVERSLLDNLPEDIPNWEVDDKKIKLSAAWLIENAGFRKGYSFSNLKISPKHTLALVNTGSATDQNILDAVFEIKNNVFKKFHISLIPEPQFIGFDKEVIKKLYL